MEISYSDYDKETGLLVTCYLTDCRVFGDEEGYIINEIQTNWKFRGKGFASKVMRRVCEEADREGAILGLSICPDYSPGSLDYDQLQSWYERLGFMLIEKDCTGMIRYPKGTK